MFKLFTILNTINYPFIAFIIAVIFIATGFMFNSLCLKLAGVVWVIYGIWEYLIYFKILCDGECNIRVDLLVIARLLILMSIGAVIYTLYQKIRKGFNKKAYQK